MRPSLNDRINRANAAAEERKSEEHQRIQALIAARREAEALAEWKKWMMLEIALVAFEMLRILEKQKEDYAPSKPDEEWSEEFCQAMRFLPEVRQFAEDCWYECME